MREIKKRHKILLTATAVTTAAGAIGLGSWASWSTSETTSEQITTGSFSLQLDGELVEEAQVPVSNFAPGDSVSRRLDVTNTGSIDFSSVSMAMTGATDSQLLDGSAKGLQVQVQQCPVAWSQTMPTGGQPSAGGWYCTQTTQGFLGDYMFHTDPGYWWSEYVGAGNGPYVLDPEEGWLRWVGSGSMTTPLDSLAVRSGPFDGEADALPIGSLQSSTGAPSTAHLLVTVSLPESTGDGQDVQDLQSDYALYGNSSATVTYTFTAVQRDGNSVTTHDGVDDANHRSLG